MNAPRLAWLTLAWPLVACHSPPGSPEIALHPAPELEALVGDWARTIPYGSLEIAADPAPLSAASAGGGLHVAVLEEDLGCAECYRIDRVGAQGFAVRGADRLGVQYGLAHLFELIGFRFHHPWDTWVPEAPALRPGGAAELGLVHRPEMRVRGLHLHTIHPIEAYRAVWDPDQPGALEEATRIFDWIVKNRGNYVQWVGLDDITPAGADAAWRAHTRELIAAARRRGLRVGFALQLFGQSNLQSGFDLIDSETVDEAALAEMERRWQIVSGDGVEFDVYNLSFGEFFGADPEMFVDSVNLALEGMLRAAPDAEMMATIHVGDTEELRVEYQGEELPYYFLVRFADPRIVPLVHTVMYYNLFEDAGGAYHHEEFDEHRAFILERLAAGERVAYFPETAYWVAFDNSVPTYAPLYIRSRWLDLDRLAGAAAEIGAEPLGEHILFSTGWEWGYWQNDWAALRASFRRPARWQDLVREMFAPRPAGDEMAELVVALTELEHAALIEERLAGYMAGRDLYIDLGDQIDIVSQPDRTTFDDLAAADAAARADFEAGVLRDLEALATGLEALADRAAELGGPRDRVRRELEDGVAVTALRARFIATAYRAVLAHLAGDAGEAERLRGELDELLAAGHEVVARRHADLHFPDPARLLEPDTNATFYQWGYLKQADELCYWERERVEVERLTAGATAPIPPCVM
ncbi:MAG TPA: hypothetical protein VKZ63_13660 [Kofleriaceae bacterium]|nr:hypothetical protein [Kofleriaceae bacterium]